MNIGVVGYGTVGKAVTQGFRKKGHLVYVNDIKELENEKSHNKEILMKECPVIFICVPTPPKEDDSIDLRGVERVVEELRRYSYTTSSVTILVIKSTVIPGTTNRLSLKYPEFTFAVNPEFMRMKYALHDFLNPERIVVGTGSIFARTTLRRLYGIWKCPKFFTDPTTAETIKYVSNVFFTTKVAFACEVLNICKVLGVDAKEVMNAVSLDSRIGKSHLDPTLGKIPKNSACLPKDTSALIRFLEQKGYESKFLKTVYETGVEK